MSQVEPMVIPLRQTFAKRVAHQASRFELVSAEPLEEPAIPGKTLAQNRLKQVSVAVSRQPQMAYFPAWEDD